MTLYILSNRHLRTDLKDLKIGDHIVIENFLSTIILKYLFNSIDINKDVIIHYIDELLEGKLDHIVGNPPYQDNKESDAGSLYIDITKKCLDLLSDNGVIDFITPTTIAQPKKDGFSLSGIKGLELIDYSVAYDFNVGVQICRWKINKSYSGKVKIVDLNYSVSYRAISDYMCESCDLYGFSLFEKIKSFDTRMFTNERIPEDKSKWSSKKTETFPYKMIVNRFKNKIKYVSIIPNYENQNKLFIAISRDISEDNMIVSKDNYVGVQTLVAGLTEYQIDNLKRFLLSDTVSKITRKYKKLYKTGFMNILRFFLK